MLADNPGHARARLELSWSLARWQCPFCRCTVKYPRVRRYGVECSVCGGVDYEHDVKIISITGSNGKPKWLAYLSFYDGRRRA
jgi:hypothetical protein